MATVARRWHRWVRSVHDHWFAADVALATVLGVVAMVGFVSATPVDSEQSPDLWGALLIVGQSLALAGRRRFVWPSFVAVVGLTVVYWVSDYPATFDAFSLLAVYAATVHGGDERRRVWHRVGVGVLVLTGVATIGAIVPSENLPGVAVVGILTIHATAAFVGEAVYDRRRRMEELQARAERAETERELLARQAVLDERARIAREMHDVIAHGVSVMVVQAGAAERAVDGDPERARRALADIQQVGRDALAEMRQLLGALRGADDPTPRLEPQSTLADVHRVVERANRSGVATTLHVSGDRPTLPIGVDMAGYRVVQEALTNVIKHGGAGASSAVEVTYTDDAVRIEVIDDGVGSTAASLGETTGQGIRGMRERVELFGGELRAGPRPGGGFRILAVLPVEIGAASVVAHGGRR